MLFSPLVSEPIPDAAVILDGPDSMTVAEGEMAWFDCTILCTHSFRWFQVGKDGFLTSTGESIMVETMDASNCESYDDAEHYYMQRLGILGTLGRDGDAFQCAASPRCNGCSQFYYARAALMTVQPGMCCKH